LLLLLLLGLNIAISVLGGEIIFSFIGLLIEDEEIDLLLDMPVKERHLALLLQRELDFIIFTLDSVVGGLLPRSLEVLF